MPRWMTRLARFTRHYATDPEKAAANAALFAADGACTALLAKIEVRPDTLFAYSRR
jgi:hypothetical protein